MITYPIYPDPENSCLDCDGRLDGWGKCVDCLLDNTEELASIETFRLNKED